MYNGYNFYPSDGSPATPPFFLMPYQFDPLFMPCELADNNELDKAIGTTQNSEMVCILKSVISLLKHQVLSINRKKIINTKKTQARFPPIISLREIIEVISTTALMR